MYNKLVYYTQLIALALFLLFVIKTPVYAANVRDVVISEIGWAGTAANTADEWIELYNNTPNAIDLTGWTLSAADGTPSLTLSGTLAGNSYFLLERTDDTTISNVFADQIFTGALSDGGESLQLKDSSGNVIDTANSDSGAWPGGTGGSGDPPRASMERISLTAADVDSNWTTNNGTTRNGTDANGNLINGTPKSANSQGVTNTPVPISSPTNTPTPTKASTPTPTKIPTQTPTKASSAPTPTPTKTAAHTPTKSAVAKKLSEKTPSAGEAGIVLSQNIATETPTPTPEVLTAGFMQTNLGKILIVVGGIFLVVCGAIFFKWKKETG